ncbi:hypothetical protein HHL16_19080 [Pseudoflavitalea sp. G-6-1-2]|uniref:hypothetical protein n=1 Tax=Pseudoflavitalea sp. G-6-1-2 TaxID=2728841 RepID=UPI00146A77F3|nr:hypothetical protein [Pseudoflavitalea sp. G-6-1-2]NML22989.1 hypothetical protein [Pseudoflavitalea sp. G-6-1-2]
MINQLFEEKMMVPPVADTKEKFEIEKLKLEIKRLNRPVWKSAGFWTSLLPIIISIGTLVILYLNGTFDSRARMLELRKENLSYEINTFERRKETLVSENLSLQFKLMRHQRLLDTLHLKNAGKDKQLAHFRERYNNAIELIRLTSLQDSLERAAGILFGSAAPVKKELSPEDIWSDTSSVLKK